MTLTLAAAPALPLHTAGKYVAGAYVVFLAILLIYVAIMATRLSRTERELAELTRDVAAAREPDSAHLDPGTGPGAGAAQSPAAHSPAAHSPLPARAEERV